MGAFSGLGGGMIINPFMSDGSQPPMYGSNNGIPTYMPMDVPTFGKTPSQTFRNNQKQMAGRFDLYMNRKNSSGIGSGNPED